MKYYECPHCGCALDFGERCDCLDKTEEMRKEMEEALDYSKPQVSFRLEGMKKGA